MLYTFKNLKWYYYTLWSTIDNSEGQFANRKEHYGWTEKSVLKMSIL